MVPTTTVVAVYTNRSVLNEYLDNHRMDEFQDDEFMGFTACTSSADRSIKPLVWCRANEEKFPTLANFAREILPVQSYSVASESHLSSAGTIIEESRSRLSVNTVCAYLRVYYWRGFVG